MGLETIAAVASIGSAVVGGIGAIQQGNAASAAAGYNAKVAAQNAELATRNAEYTAAQGEQNVAAAQAETRAKVAAITANQAASGVDINSGSSVDVRASEAKLGMLNALNIRSQAVRQAYGYQTDAASLKGQSNLDKSQAKAAKIGGYLNAAGTVLGGAAKAYDYSNPSSASDYHSFLSKSDPVNMTSSDSPYFNFDINGAGT